MYVGLKVVFAEKTSKAGNIVGLMIQPGQNKLLILYVCQAVKIPLIKWMRLRNNEREMLGVKRG